MKREYIGNMSKIVFSTLSDTAKVRFLSNSSNYPFTLEDRIWSTVDHYAYAKRFEGTQLEDIIREAPTVFQAKKLATRYKYVFDTDPLTEKKIKVKGYGQQYQYRIRDDWKEMEGQILQDGIKAKFAKRSALKKKLLETRPAILIDSTNPLVGPILEKIRKDIQFRDLPFTEIKGENKKIFLSLIYLTAKISKLEGWDKVYKEMVEDAVYTLTNEEIGHEVINVHQVYSQKRKERCIPNYKKILDGIQKQLPVKMSFQTGSSEILTSFFAWKENFASSSDKSVLNEQLKDVKTIKISLRPGRRWYRDQVPPKMKKVKSKKKRKKVVEKTENARKESQFPVETRWRDSKYYI
uniref:NADAR domain protein n=1 Tax=Marseillevirus LCMAC101 TaxID=2506602 RepID=A0A481YT55_9VIRU|nr:MAG: NADAR domain protein [Marseillevirus LCMAC101]